MKTLPHRLIILALMVGISVATFGQITVPTEKKAAPKPPASSPPLTTNLFTVGNALEFVNAIGSNRTIQLRAGAQIYLPDATHMSGANYRFQEVFDGLELVIFDVSNL